MAKDRNLQKIDEMLKSSQKNEIMTSTLLIVFTRNIGMTKSYKIYYYTERGSVIEAYVNNDILRGKNYVISMFTLIQKSK